MDVEDKIELLYDIETQFTFTGQDKIPVNDIEARFMKGKKGNFMIAYNIQSAVDYDTKLIGAYVFWCFLYVLYCSFCDWR